MAITPTKTEHPVAAGLRADRLETDTRSADTREATPIHDEPEFNWGSSLLTAAPPPRPGFAQRWVRVTVMGTEDFSNLMRRRNEGWNPRRPDSLPNGYFAPVVAHASLGNVICNGDMVLMERPERIHQKQQDAVNQLTRNQTAAVERNFTRNAPGGKGFGPGEVDQFDRKVSVGRRPRIADD